MLAVITAVGNLLLMLLGPIMQARLQSSEQQQAYLNFLTAISGTFTRAAKLRDSWSSMLDELARRKAAALAAEKGGTQ